MPGRARPPIWITVSRAAAAAAGGAAAQLAQHGEIVAGLEAGGGDQGPAADLVERVLELVGAVGRVDVDQDQAGLGGGELGDHPLRVVGRPDADPVAGLEAQRQQPARQAIRLALELAVGVARALCARTSASRSG